MRADRWFHTLVVVGASLSGCGGRAEVPGHGDSEAGGPSTAGTGTGGVGSSSNAGAGVGGGVVGSSGAGIGAAGMPNPLRPGNCAYQQQFVCASYEPLADCHCDPTAPLYPDACPKPLDFQCRPLVTVEQVYYVGCYCGPRELTPADCEVPESFFCNVTYPALADCHCDGPVVSESECENGNVLCCQGSEPRFGCECCSLVIK